MCMFTFSDEAKGKQIWKIPTRTWTLNTWIMHLMHSTVAAFLTYDKKCPFKPYVHTNLIKNGLE